MQKSLYLVADQIRSSHNVGSLFRTADALGVAKIYLCGYTPTPPRPEITKVALGAEKTVPWEHYASAATLIRGLKKRGVYIVALEQARGSVPINEIASPRPRSGLAKTALVVGNEVVGISKTALRRADAVVHIPMLGAKESLNVSVAAGIALYALRFGQKTIEKR